MALDTVAKAVVAEAPPVVAAIKDAATKEAKAATTMEDAAIKAVAPVAMGTNPITMIIGTTMVTTTTLTICTTTTVTTAIGTIITPETEKETII